MQIFNIANILIFTSILLNYKIGEIYLSYMVAYFSAGLLLINGFIVNTKITSKIYIYSLFFLHIIFTSLIIKVWYSDGLEFYFQETINWAIYSKAFLIFLFFILGLLYFRNQLFIFNYLNLLYVFTILFCLRFWLEGMTIITSTDIKNIDSLRYYPAWIGGWNTISYFISISILYILTIKGLQKKNTWFVLGFLMLTLIATQSRGGLYFLIISLVGLQIRYRFFKISAKYFLISLICIICLSFLPIFKDIIIERFWGAFFGFDRTDISYMQFATSGRTVQWLDFYVKFFLQDNTFQYYTGYGLGHYGWQNKYAIETSVHNTLLQFIYDFGLPLGLSIFLCLSWKLIFFKKTVNYKLNAFFSGLGMITFLTLLVQDLFFITQLIPVVSMLMTNFFQQKLK